MRSKSLATSAQFRSKESPAVAGGVLTTLLRARQKNLPLRREVADVELIAFRGVVHVDVPVVHPAVNLHVSDRLPGGGGRAVAEDLVQPQHGPRPVPILSQGHLRPFDALPAEFPVGVQPVGIADHDDQAVLGLNVPVGDASERQVLGLGQLSLDLFQAP